MKRARKSGSKTHVSNSVQYFGDFSANFGQLIQLKMIHNCRNLFANYNDFSMKLKYNPASARIKIMSGHSFSGFLGHFIFSKGIVWVARWNGLGNLVPKHMWKNKIRSLELKKDEKQESTFFGDTLYCVFTNVSSNLLDVQSIVTLVTFVWLFLSNCFPGKRQSHIGCICLISPLHVFKRVFKLYAPEDV